MPEENRKLDCKYYNRIQQINYLLCIWCMYRSEDPGGRGGANLISSPNVD
jgi:hypothetical protein